MSDEELKSQDSEPIDEPQPETAAPVGEAAEAEGSDMSTAATSPGWLHSPLVELVLAVVALTCTIVAFTQLPSDDFSLHSVEIATASEQTDGDLSVRVSSDGRIHVDGKPLDDPGSLAVHLKSNVKSPKSATVTVDQEAMFAPIFGVVKTLGRVGVERIRVVVGN